MILLKKIFEYFCRKWSDISLSFRKYSFGRNELQVGFKSGFHVWAIIWPEDMRGTNPVVGVAEKTIVPQMSGYVSMLGLLADSYGWDLS